MSDVVHITDRNTERFQIEARGRMRRRVRNLLHVTGVEWGEKKEGWLWSTFTVEATKEQCRTIRRWAHENGAFDPS